MLFFKLLTTIISCAYVLASAHISDAPNTSTRLLQGVLTNTLSNPDLELLRHQIESSAVLAVYQTSDLHSTECRALIVNFLCESGAAVTQADIERAGTELKDLSILKILGTSATQEAVEGASLSILKGILKENVFSRNIDFVTFSIAEFCCIKLFEISVKIPSSYLNAAVSKGNFDLLELILDCGVSNITPIAISTAFFNESEALEMVMMLLEAGGDPNAAAGQNCPVAFEFIANYPDFSEDMLLFMVDCGLNLELQNNNGLTLLDAAIKHDRLDLACHLDHLGVPSSITDADDIGDDDYKFSWLLFQFHRRHMQVCVATGERDNIWAHLGADVVNLILKRFFDIQVLSYFPSISDE